MSWADKYRFKLYVRNSIWISPVLSILAAMFAVILINRIDRAIGWQINIGVDTARTVMGTIAASMLTLVVVSASAVLVAVQLASAQLTPRIIVLVYRSRLRKFCVSAFVFTFTFSVSALVRIEGSVPLLTSYVAAYGFLINLALFLYFIDEMGKTLRPSTALQKVGYAGRAVIQGVYPSRLKKEQPLIAKPIETLKKDPHRLITNEVDGVVLAFDLNGLMAMAESSNCLLELVPQVGDFIAAGDPLFRIFEGGQTLSEDTLRNSVAMGQERTLEQDPTFAFRIIVDIASKALSPAINDPTTAVLAVDQIHHLLRNVGMRNLAEGRETDSQGKLRLVYRTPDWEDFVHLAVTEIRQYGRDSIQIMRRLRAMLENLIETLPERRAPMLRLELSLLQASAKRVFEDLYDQSLAETGDLQGMGGGEYREPGVPAIA
ncbi:MAG TPA: DUF2254 domain-containing protein [Pyrinomonadaceae bacterium]|nr:DUF2254 domain-containing protein [Pyrinomonadaceae bacterium]